MFCVTGGLIVVWTCTREKTTGCLLETTGAEIGCGVPIYFDHSASFIRFSPSLVVLYMYLTTRRLRTTRKIIFRWTCIWFVTILPIHLSAQVFRFHFRIQMHYGNYDVQQLALCCCDRHIIIPMRYLKPQWNNLKWKLNTCTDRCIVGIVINLIHTCIQF